jgi:hypothetical protein
VLVAVKHQPDCDDISVSNTKPQVDIVERLFLCCQIIQKIKPIECTKHLPVSI